MLWYEEAIAGEEENIVVSEEIAMNIEIAESLERFRRASNYIEKMSLNAEWAWEYDIKAFEEVVKIKVVDYDPANSNILSFALPKRINLFI